MIKAIDLISLFRASAKNPENGSTRAWTLEQRAAKLWPDNPAYQKAWVRIVTWLGDRWLLADEPVPRPRT